MASKDVIIDVYEKVCLLFKDEPKVKVCEIWCNILGQDDYPDKLITDAFEHYAENNSYRAMQIAHFNEYRSRYYYKYKELDRFNRDW